ncbi:MAG TPA: hypothetical protein VGU01_15610 [Sphingomicrobium sp.]|nr:hypothetical protein [Sphingomicrobium sp.]
MSTPTGPHRNEDGAGWSSSRWVTIDRAGLEGLAEFDPTYLYLDRMAG